ncbi:putative disease resistance protein (TIR-NBS-LRR class), partial [Trifolium medium]|nr:putative disease resistance protein (TIR-NBS-LRR class) [Trifolium medium]
MDYSSIHMISDHVLLWYDPVSCKQIMEAVDHANSTSHNPKLTFRFFIYESGTVYDEVSIKECGFRGIYKEIGSSTILEKYHVEDGNTVLATEKLMERVLPNLETVLEDAIVEIELEARRNSGNEEDAIQFLLPAMAAMEYWFDYTSTQVSFTLELPPNLLGFAYYFVLSQGHMRKVACFGCECYLDKISDHVVFWYDPVTCKQIMEAVDDVNNTSYSPKLTFRFFFDESGTVSIKECGFHWIYQEETGSSTIFESHDEDEETVPPTIFESHDEDE